MQSPFDDSQSVTPPPISPQDTFPPSETFGVDLPLQPGPEQPAYDVFPDYLPPSESEIAPGELPLATPAEGQFSVPDEEPMREPSSTTPYEERTPSSSDTSKRECPSPNEGDFFTPIEEISTDISPPGKDSELPLECPVGEGAFEPRLWASTTFTWKASGLCHKPLYFEDMHLERYGHSWGPYLQPFISAGHFFATIPVLPYKMGLYPPTECMYTLGYYRPGSCAPYLLDPIPISVRAGLAEAGAWTGLVYAFP